jgi:hypothetical protein
MPQVIQCCKNDRQTQLTNKNGGQKQLTNKNGGQKQLTNKNGRQSRPSGNACKGRKRPVAHLTLACLQARVPLVDYIKTAATAHNLAVAITRFQCFQ